MVQENHWTSCSWKKTADVTSYLKMNLFTGFCNLCKNYGFPEVYLIWYSALSDVFTRYLLYSSGCAGVGLQRGFWKASSWLLLSAIAGRGCAHPTGGGQSHGAVTQDQLVSCLTLGSNFDLMVFLGRKVLFLFLLPPPPTKAANFLWENRYQEFCILNGLCESAKGTGHDLCILIISLVVGMCVIRILDGLDVHLGFQALLSYWCH